MPLLVTCGSAEKRASFSRAAPVRANWLAGEPAAPVIVRAPKIVTTLPSRFVQSPLPL